MKIYLTWRNVFLIILFLVLIAVFVILPLLELIVERIDLFPKNDPSIQSIYSAFLIILTFFLVLTTVGLVYVAYTQLKSSHEQLKSISDSTRADFLMRLDNRYGGKQIIKARQIIQKLYRESKNIHQGNNNVPEIIHRNYIAEKINEYASDVDKSNEYVYLLNLLDFLETISFLANRGTITQKDITELMGLSLDFFYTIFSPRIEARRGKYRDKNFYSEFERLVKEPRNTPKRNTSN